MTKSLIQLIDSLFYETTVTTTIITKRVYRNPETWPEILADLERRGIIIEDRRTPPPPANDEPHDKTTVIHQDDYFLVEGQRIDVPDVVKNIPPLLLEDGNPNFDFYPNYQDAPIEVSYIGNIRYTAVDGHQLGVRRVRGKTNRKMLFDQHGKYLDAVSNDPEIKTLDTVLDDLKISFSSHKDWFHLTIASESGSVIQIHQKNVGQLTGHDDCVIFAFACARVILLTYLVTEENPVTDREDDIVSTLLAVFLADRV